MKLDLSLIEAVTQDLFIQEDVLGFSRFLLGKYLVHESAEGVTAGMIVETEAYKAPEDRGSHAYANRKTARTSTMFKKGGISYIYLCYGLHSMFNVVTGPENTAHAILVRALEPVSGLELMKQRRGGISDFHLTNGPGKLCAALGITTSDNGMPLYTKTSRIWLGMNEAITSQKIITGPRVGIAYAQECALRPWRFRIKGNPWTSKPNTVIYKKNNGP